MIEQPYVTRAEWKKHTQTHWMKAHDLWRHLKDYVPGWGYSKAEIDAFFEGEASGKKQVDWARITNKPATFPPSSHDIITSHTASGLTIGYVIRATGAASFAWQQLGWADLNLAGSDLADLATRAHSSLTGISADQHHAQSHGPSHHSGGGDAVKLDDLASPDDNTDLNASTSKHGLMMKYPGGSTNYLRADGSWAQPPGTGPSTFLALTDTPSSYTGEAGKFVKVNATPDALIFATIGAGDLPSHTHTKADITDTPWAWTDVSKTGSSLADLATRSHADLQSVTANQHHNQVHVLAGADHTASGLTIGYVIRASGATTFAWAQLQWGDIGGKPSTFPPEAHATAHQSGGGDSIKLDDLAAPDDNTDLDASTSKHGLLKKLGGGTTNFLRADGAWAAPPSGATTFLALTDTPSNYTGAANKFVRVNATPDALIFGTIAWTDVDKTGSNLADLATRAHSSLTGVTADQHHAQLHAASHNNAGADELNHDNLAGFVAAEHLSLPNTIANVLSDHTKAAHDALAINAGQVDGLEGSQFIRSDADDDFSGKLNKTGTAPYDVFSAGGVPFIRINTAGGALEVGGNDSLILACGEAHTYIRANVNLVTEYTHIGSDNHVYVYTNLQSGTWGDRKEWYFHTDGNLYQSGVALALSTRKLDDFGTPDDNTDLNATTSYHGLCPKLGGGTTNFLRADGSWAAPVAAAHASTHHSGGSDPLTFSSIGGFSSYLNQAVLTTSSPSFTGLTVSGAIAANGGITQDGFTVLNGSDTWLRTSGATGWYNATYSVGLYSTEAGKIKPYNNAKLDMNNQAILNIDWPNSDDGAGSGLDADLLDGQEGAYYLAWANITGKPSTYPPSTHATAHHSGGGDALTFSSIGGFSTYLDQAVKTTSSPQFSAVKFGATVPYINGDGTYICLETSYGTTKIGMGNASWTHFNTDATTGFYFATRIDVNGQITVYGTQIKMNSTGYYLDSDAYITFYAATDALRFNNVNGYFMIYPGSDGYSHLNCSPGPIATISDIKVNGFVYDSGQALKLGGGRLEFTGTGYQLNSSGLVATNKVYDSDRLDGSHGSEYLKLTGGTMSGALYARDHGSAATDEVVNVCYGTGSPPTASTTTIGTLFIKYTA